MEKYGDFVEVVAFSGKQGAGKDTIAEEVSSRLSKLPGTFCMTAKFASVIYEMHDAIHAIAFKYGLFPEKVKKDGPLLQLLGTEWGRTIDESIWVKAFHGKILSMVEPYKKHKGTERVVVFVTDCRFENEFDALEGATRIRLECDEEVRRQRANSFRDNTNHPSETRLDAYAKAGKFDLYFDTAELDASRCADDIEVYLKNRWSEK